MNLEIYGLMVGYTFFPFWCLAVLDLSQVWDLSI